MALLRPVMALVSVAALATGASVMADDGALREAIASPSHGSADAQLVQRGKTLYAEHCSHCHGFNMVSAGNVTFDLRKFPRDQKERFLESVVNGKNNRMPPWGDMLSLDDIEAIWAYVRTAGK